VVMPRRRRHDSDERSRSPRTGVRSRPCDTLVKDELGSDPVRVADTPASPGRAAVAVQTAVPLLDL
jgi:hypothetical protein